MMNEFGWRYTLNMIPTKNQLVRRGILTDIRDTCCVFCFREDESKSHLFGFCEFTIRFWRKVLAWIGINLILSLGEFVDFFSHCQKVKNKSLRLSIGVIRLATIWCIWLM